MDRAEISSVLGFFYPKKSKLITILLLIALVFLLILPVSTDRGFFVVRSVAKLTGDHSQSLKWTDRRLCSNQWIRIPSEFAAEGDIQRKYSFDDSGLAKHQRLR